MDSRHVKPPVELMHRNLWNNPFNLCLTWNNFFSSLWLWNWKWAVLSSLPHIVDHTLLICFLSVEILLYKCQTPPVHSGLLSIWIFSVSKISRGSRILKFKSLLSLSGCGNLFRCLALGSLVSMLNHPLEARHLLSIVSRVTLFF